MSLFDELKRRNVIRVTIAYVVLAWLMAQVAQLLLETFGAPDWVMKTLVTLFVVGLPFAVFFAWAFELTPEGVKREHEVEREKSITPHTGRKLDRAIIVLLSLALAWFAWDRFGPDGAPAQVASSPPDSASIAAEDVALAVPVVAVLPFKATGSDDGGFLAAGLHDDLLTRLSKLGAFRVISRTSVMEYADSLKNMTQIGQELGANYILEGGVQARDQRIRVNAQLIDAPADEHVWAEIYSRDLTATDLFDVQGALAIAISEAMHTTLSPKDRALLDQTPTNNTEAYNAFLRGTEIHRYVGYVGGEAGDRMLAEFEQAVRLDPEFALAWAWVSIARSNIFYTSFKSEMAESALEALTRARTLAPDLLEAEFAWVIYLYRVKREYGQALGALEALGVRAANNAQALQLKGWLQRRLGRFQAAYDSLSEAAALDPRDPQNFRDLVLIALLLDDCESTHKHVRHMLSFAPDHPQTRSAAAQFELQCTGNAAKASEWVLPLNFPEDSGFQEAFIAAFAERDLDRALELMQFEEASNPLDYLHTHLTFADIYFYLAGDEEKKNEALEQARLAFEAVEQIPDMLNDSSYAGARMSYHAHLGDVEETLKWYTERKRRFEAERKGDLFQASQQKVFDAYPLALAGLRDEAVKELKDMIENPGGYRFPMIDMLPIFDSLRDHPGYIELRERYGELYVPEDNP